MFHWQSVVSTQEMISHIPSNFKHIWTSEGERKFLMKDSDSDSPDMDVNRDVTKKYCAQGGRSG